MDGQKRESFQPLSQVIWDGLQALSVAQHYAADIERPASDFAIEIQSLRKVGLSNSDLRWLICKGYVQHFIDQTRSDQPGRSVVRTESLRLVPASCFVLTPAGIAIAESYDMHPARNCRGQDLTAVPDVPTWDSTTRVLRLGPDVVAIFDSRAPAQEQILAAFEEERWPVRIDDPLTPNGEGDHKTRLNKAIHRLNKHVNSPHIHFCADGSGQGICWHHNGAANSPATRAWGGEDQ
jgi:hypothetical protein